ncbi:MAG: class I SAM-dependent methyltransferase [Prosthecobacter sp.]
MKDLVDNRKRMSLGTKVKVLGLTLKQNGILYTLLLGTYYAGSGLADRAFETMQKRRKKRGLPGLNSRDLNAEIWNAWDWEAGGDEWTPSPEWKTSLVANVLKPRVPAGSVVVEIGPGAGRWTEHLIPIASDYTGIDISSTCVEVCSKKFAAEQTKARFRVNQGNNLPGVADGSVDIIWSFDVFVHINLADIGTYLEEFRRVLKPGGRAIIHHGTTAGHGGGWRSDATTAELNALIASKGLRVAEQFSDWQDGSVRHEVGLYRDQVTVIEKAG